MFFNVSEFIIIVGLAIRLKTWRWKKDFNCSCFPFCRCFCVSIVWHLSSFTPELYLSILKLTISYNANEKAAFRSYIAKSSRMNIRAHKNIIALRKSLIAYWLKIRSGRKRITVYALQLTISYNANQKATFRSYIAKSSRKNIKAHTNITPLQKSSHWRSAMGGRGFNGLKSVRVSRKMLKRQKSVLINHIHRK